MMGKRLCVNILTEKDKEELQETKAYRIIHVRLSLFLLHHKITLLDGRTMEPKNLVLLSDFDCKSKENTIKVKVLRLWKKPNPYKFGQFYSIEMVIMDEMGTKMQGQVWNTYFQKHEKFLHQNQSYFIEKPQLASNGSKYKHFLNDNIISLNLDTNIRKCNNFNGPVNGFEITSFNSILEGKVSSNARIDFIGYVEEWSPRTKTHRRDGKPTWKMDLKLKDLDGLCLSCTLWEEYCDEMLDYIEKHKEEANVVLIVQFGSFSTYKGNTIVSNAFDITKLFINEDIEEIMSFKTSYIKKYLGATASSQRSIGSCGSCPLEEEFFNSFKFSSIGRLNEISEITGMVVVGTIKGVDNEEEWHYIGCQSCSKKVFPSFVLPDDEDGGVGDDVEFKQILVCSNPDCKVEPTTAVPIYKIPIRVQDCTGTTTLTLFDRDAVVIGSKGKSTA